MPRSRPASVPPPPRELLVHHRLDDQVAARPQARLAQGHRHRALRGEAALHVPAPAPVEPSPANHAGPRAVAPGVRAAWARCRRARSAAGCGRGPSPARARRGCGGRGSSGLGARTGGASARGSRCRRARRRSRGGAGRAASSFWAAVSWPSGGIATVSTRTSACARASVSCAERAQQPPRVARRFAARASGGMAVLLVGRQEASQTLAEGDAVLPREGDESVEREVGRDRVRGGHLEGRDESPELERARERPPRRGSRASLPPARTAGRPRGR